MYLQKQFVQNDREKLKKLIDRNGFSTVLSLPKNQSPLINHLPLIFSSTTGEHEILIGHMARANPQWKHFKENPECTVIINGEHTYISPRWYKSGRDVPTWNYAVAHLHGTIELVEDYNGQVDILKQITAYFERSSKTPWHFELPRDLKDEKSLTNAIISFKFRPDKIETKFKLSQNRSIDDREGAIAGLSEERVDDMSMAIRDMMRENDLAIKPSWVPPTLATNRLILRPIELTDAEAIFNYAKNPNVSRYTLWEPHRSSQESLNYIKDYIFGYYSKGVPEPFGISLKEDPQKIIGTVGCFWTSKQARAMELAYAIGEEYWGKGIVAEASHAVIEFCFKEFSLKRVQARCKAENKPSARVMEKIGMTYEGTLKSAVFHRDRYWDMAYYAKVVD